MASKIKIEDITYLNPSLLKTFVNPVTFEINPSRTTGLSSKKQRRLAEEVKKARIIALLPFCDRHE